MRYRLPRREPHTELVVRLSDGAPDVLRSRLRELFLRLRLALPERLPRGHVDDERAMRGPSLDANLLPEKSVSVSASPHEVRRPLG